MTTTVEVAAPGGSYPVVIGHGAASSLDDLIGGDALRVAVVTQDAVAFSPTIDRVAMRHTLAPGEAAKGLATIEDLCRAMAQAGLSRRDVVVAVGGGVVTDVGGFAAAVYLRGIRVVHVATTLLGMIDAAVGGKCGVNIPEGKNLIGAFWQPAGVICDLDALATLPERDYKAGLGELAKYHFLIDEPIDATADLEAAVATCVAYKGSVVAADEREGGQRALLNYGHTLAHALEIDGSFDLRHGEAVAVGLCFAARLARRLGRIDDARVDEHHRVVTGYGLSDELPADLDVDHVVELMGRDKKAHGDLTFVLDGPNGPEVVTGVPADAVVATLEEMGATR